MKLTKDFLLDEFYRSQTASRRGIYNTPPEWAIDNLRELCVHVLQPLRTEIGAPVIITSGYRCAALNRAIKGAKNSQHINGEAADFYVAGMQTGDLCDLIASIGLPYDQMIDEFGAWVHISYAASKPIQRGERLTATRSKLGKTIYRTEV